MSEHKTDGDKKMICEHCKQDLGEGDSYDLYKNHLSHCNSKLAQKIVQAQDAEQFGYDD